MLLMAQDGSSFHTHRNQSLPNYLKEPIIFPYFRQNHSTLFLQNNRDLDSSQDIHFIHLNLNLTPLLKLLSHTLLLKPFPTLILTHF